MKARDVGIEVVYEGIRLTPEEIATSARDEGVHVIGLSILSGSHGVLVVDVLERLRAAGCASLPVVVGGIIPEADVQPLKAAGVAAVYTPKDFELTRIMRDVVGLVAERNGVSAAAWERGLRSPSRCWPRSRRPRRRRSGAARSPRARRWPEALSCGPTRRPAGRV